MAVPQILKSRYEIREMLGQGGSGAVYRAYDSMAKREVALKALRDAPARGTLEKFFKECEVLAAIDHPGINEVFDAGEYAEDGNTKAFFVARLIPGMTLEYLIRSGSQRLTVDRAVEIVCRTCRAVQAAHERGIVHGGISPGNIFVMDEDAVKVTDFGVAAMAAQAGPDSVGSALHYVAPEQLQMQAPSAGSDIFALGAVAYEALTRRCAFDGTTQAEIAGAVLRVIPPPASEINPAVGDLLSRAVHKAIAKQPGHRYANAGEFADILTKALRNEPIEILHPARIQSRLERAQKAFELGDLQAASEGLTELETEGHINAGMTTLRRQIELAARMRAIGQLLESARTHSDREEYLLALENIEEIFKIDPGNAQALGLRASIEKRRMAQNPDKSEAAAGTNCVKAEPQTPEADANVAEAEKLVAQGKALCAQQWFQEGLDTMRKALALVPDNAAVRGALIDTLLDRARVLLEAEWRAAEPLIEQALELDANNAVAKGLRTAAADHKRDEAVVRCFTEARQFRAIGDLESALRVAEACYAEYPLDPRLQQLRDILRAEIEKTRRSKQPEDQETIRYLEGAARACSSHTEVSAMLERAREIAARYPDRQEFQAPVASIEHRLGEMSPAAAPSVPDTPISLAAPPSAVAPEPAEPPEPPKPVEPAAFASAAPAQVPAPPPPEPATLVPQEPRVAPVPAAFEAAPPVPPPVVPPAAEGGPQPAPPPVPRIETPPPATPVPPRPKKKAKNALLWVAAGAVGVFVILFGVLYALTSPAGAPPGAVAVKIRTTPPGATIRIDGKVRGTSDFDLALSPGKYQLEAQLEGYQPAAIELNAASGASPVALTLQPLPHAVRIITDLTDGKVAIDDQPAHDLQDGQAILDGLPPGAHTVKITSKAGDAVLALNVLSGKAPVLTAPPSAKNLVVLVVANAGGNAHVYTSINPARVDLDGRPAGDAAAGGLELRDVAPGTHEIAAGDGRTQIRKTVEIGGAPSLTAFLQSDQNIGTILVLAGEDGAQVYIDGKPWRRMTSRGGQLRIPREPKRYRVRVAKSGFEDAPEQLIQIAKGEEKRVVFKLVPKPTTARLFFRGATAGAQVFLDGREVGTVGPDGAFQAASIPPGDHGVELRSGKLRSRAVRRSFAVGQTVELAAAEVAVRSVTGALRLNVTPSAAQVTVARAGGGNIPVTGAMVELEEGSYTVSARAAGYAAQSTTVQVAGGQTAQVNLALVREKPKVVVGRMEGWEKPWTQDGEWYVRKGGGAVLYKAGGPGTYAFNLMLASGGGVFRGKDLEWIANWVDGRNYILYRLEKDGFRRIVVANGKKTESPKRPHGLDMKQVLATVEMEVTPEAIVNHLKVGEKWTVVDTYSAPGSNLTSGRFGINIKGNDEMRLSGFGFYPKE